MKVHLDFVTNSSTASYVMLGFEIPKDFDFFRAVERLGRGDFDPDEAEDLFYEVVVRKDFHADVLHEDGLARGQHVIGKFIARVCSDDCAGSKIVDFADFQESVEAMRERLGLDTPVKVYTGIMAA